MTRTYYMHVPGAGCREATLEHLRSGYVASVLGKRQVYRLTMGDVTRTFATDERDAFTSLSAWGFFATEAGAQLHASIGRQFFPLDLYREPQ